MAKYDLDLEINKYLPLPTYHSLYEIGMVFQTKYGDIYNIVLELLL